MAAAAIIVTAVIAVCGWLVSQAQARRAARRNMRIEYLVSAYRRLERASNRPLTSETTSELEAAVADVMLLGSPEQVALAEAFVKKFAAEHQADSQPLLLTLRASLRQELLLGELPQTAYVSLRVSADGDMASETARVWQEALATVQQSLRPELEAIDASEDELFNEYSPTGKSMVARRQSPQATITRGAGLIRRLLTDLLAPSSNESIAGLSLSQLASRALQLGLIDANLADAINGLAAMRRLSAYEQERLTEQQASEFVSIAAAIAYVLQIALRRSGSAETKT
jgi:hypothetical protein